MKRQRQRLYNFKFGVEFIKSIDRICQIKDMSRTSLFREALHQYMIRFNREEKLELEQINKKGLVFNEHTNTTTGLVGW